MATTPKLVGPSDPALLKSFETQTPSVARTSPPTVSATGTATSTGGTISRSIAPTVAGETTTYTQATQASSGTELFIVSSNNNDANDIVTVYNTQKEISVSAVNQTINNYKVTNTNTYGDSNVVTLLSAFGSNTISTTGLITGNGGGLSNVPYANVTGTPTLGNIATTNYDGNASNVLHGDGTWSADQTTYGNSNVVTLLSAFGSNTITTTGNISVGNITATNIGNIANINLTGSNSNVLYGNGVFAPASGGGANTGNWAFDDNTMYNMAGGEINNGDPTHGATAGLILPNNGNAGAVTSLFNTYGNIGIAVANLANTANTSVWSFGVDGNLTLPANTFAVNYANGTAVTIPTVGNIATLNLDGNVSNLLTGNGTYVAIPVVPTVGNIATLNLDGSNSNVLYGNGVFAAVAGGNANTGNVTFNDINVIGTGNLKLQPASANASAYLDIFLTAGPDIHIAGNGETVILGTDDYANVAVNVNGNVSIQANAGTPQTWNFGTDGNLTLPLGSTINNAPDIVTVTLDQFTDGGYPGTQVFNKVSDTLYELSPGGPYMTLISAVWYLKISVSTYYSSTDLITWSTVAGGLPAPIGSPTAVATMNLEVGGNVWTFDAEGGLTLPIGVTIDYNGNVQYPTIMADSGKLFSVQGQGNTGSAAMAWTVDPNAASQYAAVSVSRAGGDNLAKVILQAQSDSGNVATAKTWQFSETGNLTLPGNTFAVNYANGTQVSIGGGSGNTGNVTFDDNIVIGTGDEFGFSGLYLAVGPDSIANGTVQYLRVRGGDAPTHIHLDTGNNQFYDQYFGDDAKYVKLELGDAGNVVVGTDDAAGNSYNWTFTSGGNFILANGNSVIQSIANSSLDPTLPNVSTMTLTPDQNYNSQALVLDPTAPGHIHLRAYAFSNIDEPSANIFLGGEDTAFEITSGANNQAVIHSNGKAWTFGDDGNISSDTLTFTTTFANVKTVEYQTAGVWDLYVEDGITGSNTAASRLNVSFKDNLIDKPQVYIENTKESDGIALRWTFDENGNLNFPRDVAGNTDPYLSIVGGATPTIVSTAASLAGPANLAIQSNYLNLSGFTGEKITFFPDDGLIATDYDMVLTTNVGGGNTYTWTLDATGNLTLPGNIFAVNYANGTQVPLGGGGNVTLPLANGNSNFDIAVANGNATITANGTSTWTFDNTGNLNTAGDIVGPANANFTIYSNAAAHEFIFADDGTFYAPDNVVLGGDAIYIGPGANTLTGIEHEVFIASSNHFAYVQGVINNVSDNGSAEWVALGAKGDDSGGWGEVGFTSSGFGDANYTITGAGDGYVFAQAYAPGSLAPAVGGGNLVLATGNQGTTKDIIFGTGGFLTGNIFGRISNANNSFELSRANATITFPDGSIQSTAYTGGGGGNSISNGTSNVSVVSADGNVVIGVDNDAASWTFATDGNIYALPETDLILVVADPNGDGYAVKQSVTDGTTELSRTSLEDGQFSIYTNLDGAAEEWRFNGNTLQVSTNSTVRGFDSNVVVQAMFAGTSGKASLQSVSNSNDPNIFTTIDATTTGANISVYNGGSNSGVGYTWQFANDGKLTFPGTPRIDTATNNFEVQAAEAINFEANTVVNIYTDTSNNAFQWQFGDDGNLTLPDTTSVLANVNITLEANDTGNITGLNLIGDSNANLYAHGNVKIVSDSSNTTATWTFGADGNLTIPGTSGGFIKTASNASIGVAAVDNGTNNPAQLLSINAGSGAATSIVSAYATNATIQTNASGNINTWAFDNAGNLTLPTGGQIIVSGGLVSSGASPAPTINGFSITNSVGISGNGNIAGNNISATGNISGNTNGFTIGYLNIPQVAAANATLALTDAGKHYYSTTAGNFTLTIPTNANVAFATGTAISIVVQAAGNILVNADTGVTLYMAGNSTAANRAVGGYGMATLMKVGTDTWFINGTGVA